jgi:cytoskeletal protein CcmA (bactofilin family)
MKVSGSNTLPKGKIEEELISSGSTRVNGDLECEDFKSSGSLKGTGNLTINGDFRNSGSFKLTGSVTINGNAKSSGSTTIEGELLIKGEYIKSGSLKAGDQVEAIAGARISGSTTIQGSLMSKKDVVIKGASTIEGNIKADSIFIGMDVDYLRPWRPYKIRGNVIADNEVDIKKTIVKGDVKGRDVKIGFGSEVKGAVYYVDSIEISSKATLAKKPVQIKE